MKKSTFNILSFSSRIHRRPTPIRFPQSHRRRPIRFSLSPFFRFTSAIESFVVVVVVAVAGLIKKRVEDVVPIATGHEREEIQADLEGFHPEQIAIVGLGAIQVIATRIATCLVDKS